MTREEKLVATLKAMSTYFGEKSCDWRYGNDRCHSFARISAAYKNALAMIESDKDLEDLYKLFVVKMGGHYTKDASVRW